MPELDMDAFLGHSNRGGKRNYLTKWKDSDAAAVSVWLHTGASIVALWRHGMPKVVQNTDKDTKQVKNEVWTDRLVCFEEEDVLTSYRDKKTGIRDTPPKLCPICLMIEHVMELVRDGRLSPVAPLFRWHADDASKSVTIHAAGLYNGFGGKNPGEKMYPRRQPDGTSKDVFLKELMQGVSVADGGPIYARDAWKQNVTAKLEYIFTVVDNADPTKIQIAIEPGLLGDKVKGVIVSAIKSAKLAGLPPEVGDPTRNPYAFRWEYFKDEQEFGKKYNAYKIDGLTMPAAVQKLIQGTPAPEVASFMKRPNWKELRTKLEAHYIGPKPLPWDKYFEAVAKLPADAAQEPAPPAGLPAPAQQYSVPTLPGPSAPPQQAAAVAAPGTPDVSADDHVACDACQKEIRLSDPKCPHCGHVYEVEAAPLPPPPAPPKLPSRSEARARLAAGGAVPTVPQVAQQAFAAPAAAPPQDTVDRSIGGGYTGDPDDVDDVPFVLPCDVTPKYLRRRNRI